VREEVAMRGWFKAHPGWTATIIGAAALFVGVGIGAAGTDQQGEIDRQDAQIATLRGELADSESAYRAQAQDLRSYRADALKYRRHRARIAVEAAAAEQAARQRRAEARARARREREDAQQAAQGTISGDGTWHVGEDFAAGTYRADAGDSCYWARLNTPHGGGIDDIIENGLGSGAQTVQLNEGEWFETSDCGQWQKIG
jgi:hypothetical protein